MDRNSLELFISAAYHLNFTKAAEDCHVVQATMSRQIAALEEEIGAPLFYREKRGVSLTPAGKRLFGQATAFLEQYNDLIDDCRRAAQDLPKLCLGFGPHEQFLLGGPLKTLQQQYGNKLEIELMGYTYKIMTARFRAESIQAGFCSERVGTSSTMLEFLPLYKAPWQVAAAADSPFWQLPRREQALLRDQVLVTTYQNEFEEVQPWCHKRELPVRSFVETNFPEAQMARVRAGLGVALLPPAFRDSLPPDVRMEDVLAEPFSPTLGLAYAKDSSNPGIGLLKQICRDLYVLPEA